MNKKQIILGATLVCALDLFTFAQKNSVSAGGEATGSGGKASFSIGQIDYKAATGSGGTITQGVQQPFEITSTTDVADFKINLESTIYPNPVLDALTLTIPEASSKQLQYIVVGLDGKVIDSGSVITDKTNINLGNVSSGVYFLSIRNTDQKEVKSFKIIKNN